MEVYNTRNQCPCTLLRPLGSSSIKDDASIALRRPPYHILLWLGKLVKKITRMDERNLDGLTCSQNDDGPIVYSFLTEDREDTPPFTVRRCFNTSGQLR
ncbi:hypothetical protein NC651_012832 [Populus alba x Populus x berolinensis]|nr:hypothetical protein NC651_012832 [Populus alba x Populus x berolinensis]